MGRGLLIFNKWSGQYDFRKPHSYFLKLCLLFCGFHFFHELKELRLCWQHYQNMSFLHKYTFSSQVNYKWITFLTFPHIFADCFKTLEISFVLFCFVFLFKYMQERTFASHHEEVKWWPRSDLCPQREFLLEELYQINSVKHA